jgi:CO/xanthine dehydrogenase Mo-binding subunit
MTFPNGAHVVEVEIDRNTGQASLARYTAVDAVYDPVSDRLLAVSFID